MLWGFVSFPGWETSGAADWLLKSSLRDVTGGSPPVSGWTQEWRRFEVL